MKLILWVVQLITRWFSNERGSQMVAYPTALPTDAVAVLINKLRGQDVSLADLLLAEWNLQGFAFSFVSDTPSGAAALSFPDDAALATYLEDNCVNLSVASAPAAIPWEILVPILLDLVRKWLSER